MNTTLLIVDVSLHLVTLAVVVRIFRYVFMLIPSVLDNDYEWDYGDSGDYDDYDLLDLDDEPRLHLCSCGEWVREDQILERSTPTGKYWICDYCVF